MEYYFLKKYGWKIGCACMPFFFLFIVLLCATSSGGSEEGVATAFFTTPFEEEIKYTITSNYGTRIDPIDLNKISFHSGIDLSAPAGTSIVASADGIVYEVGYSESGLGNYVYIEHDYGGLVLYTMYGHMADDSIVVNVGDKVTKGSTICVIEAMKMENDIQSEVDGVVKEIFIEPGDAVSAGDTLMVIQ